MALEERNGNYYYYKKEREGNRVVSKYYGKGELANLIAQMDEIERQEKLEKTEIDREIRQKLEEIDCDLANFEEKTKSLLEAALVEKRFLPNKKP